MRRLLSLFLVLIVACTGAPPEDATGAQIYGQVCSNCHGDDLSGGVGPALGPGSPGADVPDDFVVETISRGRGSMPAFSRTLTPEQIARVVSFLRERQAR